MNKILVALSDDECAILDERRGAVPRAVYLRQLLQGPMRKDVASHREVLGVLTAMARDGRQAAAIALERALREAGDQSTLDWILHGDDE